MIYSWIIVDGNPFFRSLATGNYVLPPSLSSSLPPSLSSQCALSLNGWNELNERLPENWKADLDFFEKRVRICRWEYHGNPTKFRISDGRRKKFPLEFPFEIWNSVRFPSYFRRIFWCPPMDNWTSLFPSELHNVFVVICHTLHQSEGLWARDD